MDAWLFEFERTETVLGGCREIPIFSCAERSLGLIFVKKPEEYKSRILRFLGTSGGTNGFFSREGTWTIECPVELGTSLRGDATAFHAILEDARSSGKHSCDESTWSNMTDIRGTFHR